MRNGGFCDRFSELALAHKVVKFWTHSSGGSLGEYIEEIYIRNIIKYCSLGCCASAQYTPSSNCFL